MTREPFLTAVAASATPIDARPGNGEDRVPDGGLASLIGRFGVPGLGEVAVRGLRTRLGRSPECELVIAGAGVAPVHAELALADGLWTLTDLGSDEGSWVDGERVTGPVPVAPGSILRLGQAILIFDPRDHWTDSAPPAPEPAPAPMAVSWPSRDEPMAPSFEWPARTPRNWWLLYAAIVLVVAAVVVFIIRAT